MSFVLLLLLFTSNNLFATPECPIVTARFPLANGTTVDNSATGWYLDASRVASTGYFAVKSNRLHAQELGGEGIWYSKVFSTAGYAGWQVAVKVSSEGDMNSSEYVKIYYKINGGSEVLLDQRTGNFGTIDFTSPALNGNSVQLVVKIYNYNNGGSQTSKYYIEEYRVFKDKGPCSATGITVTATAGNGGVLTCANPSLTLSASSTASGVSYSWTGPNGFTSNSQNPVVNTPGTYTVTGTSSSGSGTASVTITENKTPPDLSATGGSLACGSSGVTLNANSSVANVTYSWTGPNNFTSTVKNPTVSTAGNYTVTVRNPANGCTASQTVSVTSGAAASNTWVEDFALSNGATSDNGTTSWTTSTPSGSTFAVNNNEFKISGQGTTGESVWTSGVINITGKTSINLAASVRSAVTGGAVMNDTGEYADYIRFYYKLNGGAEVLFAERKSAINNHSTTYTNLSAAVSGTGTSLQLVIRARATGTDEFYYTDNVKVTAVDPAVTLATAVSGPVTCTGNATITVTPSGTISSWAWTGPNGFTSTTQNPTVTAGGQYNVTGTMPGGCTVSASVNVTENKTPPDVTATGGALGCLSSVTISASSSVSGVSYSWTGPNNFTSNSPSTSVNTAGTYTVTVRNPANGCTNTQSVQVTSGAAAPAAFWWEDFTLANGTTVDNGVTSWTLTNSGAGTISVQNNEFKVSYNAAAEAVWTSGVVDISGKSSVVISANLRSETASTNDAFESDDYMRVYYKLNGGAEVLVYDDAAGIGNTTNGTASTTVSSAALTGNTLQVIIKARNSDATERYYFDDVKLTGANTSSTITATASVTDSLTCTRTSVNLSGSSNITNATYRWTGPNNFTSTTQNPSVTAPGNYILTVTDPAAGCTAMDTVTVIRNTTVPNVTAAASGSLSCGASSVTLLGNSSTAGVTYSWTGPNNFASTAQNPQVSVAGDYILIVTNPATGCTAKDTATVSLSASTAAFWLEDFTLANGTTSDNGTTSWTTTTPSGSTFAVNNNEFKISGQGTTGESVWTSGVINITGKTSLGLSANVRSAITGGAVMNDTGEFADYIRFYYKLNGGAEVLFAEKRSAINNHSTTYSNISLTGLSTGTSLQLVIRARATGTDEFYYVDNVKVTGVDAVAGVSGPLSCKATSVTLSGSSSTAGVTYSWTGPNNFTSIDQNPVVTVAGTYTLTVTAPGGCTATSTVTVSQNIVKPNLTVTQPAVLTCTTTSVSLAAATTTTGTTITWTGFAAGQNPVAVTAPGKYYVTVKDTANGCTSMDSVTVTRDAVLPNLTIAQPPVLTCGTTSVNLTASSTTNGVTFTWTGFAAGQNPVAITAPGTYTVTAKTTNGCTSTASVTVTQSVVKPNLTLTQPAVLTCTTTSVNLTAATTTSGAIITWTGFAAGQNPVSVTAPGKYYATATGTNGCIQKDSVTVTQDAVIPNLTVTPPAVLTCTTASVNLTAASTTTGVTFTWTGFAAGQNPVSVTTPGTYTVTARTANGCSNTTNVTVTQNIAKPNLTVTQPAVLTCATTSVNLTAATTTTGATITWTGFAAGQNPVSVTAPGTYTATATTANGCSTTASVTVTQDNAKPNLTVSQPAVLTCTTTSVNLTAASTTNGVTITWTGFAAGQNPVSVTAPGKYYAVATGSNGCTQKDSVTVMQDNAKPNLTITQPAVLTCTTTSVNLTAASTTNGATITWTGFVAGQNPVSVTAPGTYTATATTANGCSTTASVTVTQDNAKPNLTVSQPAVLTCTTTSVNLAAASTTNGVTITWTGFAAGQNPVSVTAPGTYTATATTANGCSTTASVTVTQDNAKPNLTVSQPAVLTCTTTSVNLAAASTTNGVTITWTGFAAGQNPVSVTAPGTYAVTATATNGCATMANVTVTQNIAKPNLAITQPAVLNCTTTSVNLTAATNGTSITWTGFAAGQNPVSVTAPGKYYAVATDSNGCTQKDSVTVMQDNAKPNLTITQPAVLTCTTTSVNLTAASTTNGATITWTGFAAGQNSVSVTAPGTYTATATTANGCSTTASVTVTQDNAKPNLTVSQPAVLTCTTTSVNLTAATTTTGATITWTGFVAGQNPVSVTAPGTYTATATTANGCTTTASVTVTQDNAKPNLTVSQPAVLTCTTTSVNLAAASTTNGVTITWTGFAAGQNPVSVTAPGTYTATATTANGCSTTASVTVTQDNAKPNLTVSQPAVLTCTTTSVNLTAATTTTGATITWTGFVAGQNPVSVTAPGTYTATATTANGCTTMASVTVTQDITKPNLTVTQPAVLTCTTTSVNLVAATTTTGATINWTGFAADQNPVSVTTPGKYYAIATGNNGCTQKDSVTVTQNITKPALTLAQPAILTCTTTSVNLTATTNGSGITWTGFAAGQNPVSVTAPGKYYAVATGSNGCTQKDSVTVTQDITKPTLAITQPAVLTCTNTSVNLTATTNGTTITWTGFATGQNPVSVTAPGKYYAIATASNGCTQKDSVTVTQNITKPTLAITQPAVLTCTTTSVNLAATTNGTSITWTGFAAGQNPVSVTTPGKYYAVATASNGCIQKDSVTVIQDNAKPNLTVTQPPVLTCSTTSVNLTAASTTNGATITWTGFAAGQNPVSVTAPGTYTATATTANGCSITASVTVTQDNAKPNLTVSQPAVLTCTTTSVNLTAASTTNGATITWAGFAAGQNPVSVTAPGTYTATATTANGCSTIASVTVTQDIAKPNLTVTQPPVLTCSTTSVNLTAASTTNGATITWTGFAAGQNPVSVTAPGTYTATATTANGCSTTASVTVTQDNAKPNLTVSQPAVLTCTTTSVNLTAASTTNGANIAWTGFAAGQNPVSVTAPGTYTATATTANGCSTTVSVTVTQDNSKPNLTVTQPPVLTCSTTSVNLTAASTTNGATITWTGFAAGQNPVSVTAPGTYTATATTANGCSTTASVTVTQDIAKPNLTVSQPAVLTCTTTSVNLTAASTTNGATITWTGFAAGQNPVGVTAPGTYTATATTANGCSTTASVTVTQDIAKPNLTVSQPAVLTCTTTSVNLTAASTTNGATITWTGFAAGQNPVGVTAPGTYTATATTANGCSTTASVTVTQDIAKPNLTITQPAVLTCSTTSVNLTAASTTNGATITWTGFAAGQNPVSVTAPGTYTATATTANGCSTTASVTVTQDITKPNLSITQPAVLTCATTSVNLAATTNGTTIIWTGFAAGQNPVSITAPGKYYAVATGSNGCTQKDSITVTQDITKPNLSITQPAVLTCTTTSVNLTATTNGTTITWTGFAAGQNPVSVTAPGKYYAVATGSNGCTQKDSVTVTQDITKPNLSITQPAVLTCTTTSVNLAATTNGTTITWTGFAAGQNPVSVTAPGKYYAVATGSNGCTQKDSITVTQDITKPNLSITQPAVLTCATTSVNLAATTNGTTITWTGFAAGQNPVSVTAPGKYYAVATGSNGCTQKDSITVTQDITKPNLSITQPAVLTCTTTSVNLAATTNGTTITWTGFAAGQNPVSVTAPGKYYAIATASNGCTQKDSVTVTQDITKPNLSITQPAVLTCATTSVNLAATTNGTTITWTGFAAGQNPVSVTAPGKYYAVATGTNGCTQKDSVTVTQNITKPTLSITQPAVLNCNTTAVNLTAATNGTSITWTGFTAGQNPVSVITPGKYYVMVSSNVNGCTNKDSVTVIQDLTAPQGVDASNNGPLTCARTSVTLTGVSSSSNVSYRWTNATNTYNATTAIAFTTAAGTYTLTVTNTATGCTSTKSTVVVQNNTAPATPVTGNDGPLTCTKTNVTLTGNSTTAGVTYRWTDGAGFDVPGSTAITTKAGTYTLTVTDPGNSCTATKSTIVTENKAIPECVINPPATAPDAQSFNVLTAKDVTNVSYAWTLTATDPQWSIVSGADASSVVYMSGDANTSGTFKLVVKDKTNGCENTASLKVTTAAGAMLVAAPATANLTERVAKEEQAPLEYNIFPNPFVERACITFKSPVSGRVEVAIFGAMGNRETVLFSGQAQGGLTYKLFLDAHSIPPGMHYCVIRANGKIYSAKLILAKW
ncbi:hypothetical protein [Chitinophaga sp. GbtcB8]|uniref:hypothetical protein n=1 Tax=Chitinophaga sp. GbtcB8 TaxID=2824753 RepID=UPI001C300830|nr:hypothetical protein [Chitinophaga sp. GbtcB8]